MAIGETYEEFVKKFDKNAKKTTDDCYTPQAVYDAVLNYVLQRWPEETANARIIRPFYPGGDYENEEYGDGCVVVDNPPFSMFSRIVRFYGRMEIPFFLFAPSNTAFQPFHSEAFNFTILMTNTKITYENGARVPTSFVTNLPSENIVESVPELRAAIRDASPVYKMKGAGSHRGTIYPPEIYTAAALCNYAGYTDFAISRKSSRILSHRGDSNYFGCALVISDTARARLDEDIARAREVKLGEKNMVPLSEEARRAIDELNAAEQSAQ